MKAYKCDICDKLCTNPVDFTEPNRIFRKFITEVRQMGGTDWVAFPNTVK